MSKVKVRYFATIDGYQTRLITIEEKFDGSLLVSPIQSANFEHEIIGDVPQKSAHFSIHNSDSSLIGGTTITYKLELKNGEKRDKVSFIKGDKKDLLWVLWCQRMMLPNPARIKKKKYNAKDQSIDIGAFSTKRSTLLMFVVVAGREELIQDQYPYEMVLFKSEFKKYVIGVFITYVDLPTLRSGRMRFIGTAPERVNGSVIDERKPIERGPLIFDAMVAHIGKCMIDYLDEIRQHYLLRNNDPSVRCEIIKKAVCCFPGPDWPREKPFPRLPPTP